MYNSVKASCFKQKQVDIQLNSVSNSENWNWNAIDFICIWIQFNLINPILNVCVCVNCEQSNSNWNLLKKDICTYGLYVEIYLQNVGCFVYMYIYELSINWMEITKFHSPIWLWYIGSIFSKILENIRAHAYALIGWYSLERISLS